jgi:glycosyltransferase involved in cell wall biosynthesis
MVSVCLTTYNRSSMLARCLTSIITQTYYNIEIVIVDDASDDDTENIVSNFKFKHCSYKYIRLDSNSGNAIARNIAIKNASSHIIAFMDDDDYWIDNEKLFKQVEILNKIGDSIICTGVRRFLENEVIIDESPVHPDSLKADILKGNGLIYSPTVLTTKHIVSLVNGFDEKMPRGIDSDFFRTSIVKHDVAVYFLKDITTAVVEYGHQRMTPIDSQISLKNNLRSHLITFKKFYPYFILYPRATLTRMFYLIVTIKKIIFMRLGNKYE